MASPVARVAGRPPAVPPSPAESPPPPLSPPLLTCLAAIIAAAMLNRRRNFCRHAAAIAASPSSPTPSQPEAPTAPAWNSAGGVAGWVLNVGRGPPPAFAVWSWPPWQTPSLPPPPVIPWSIPHAEWNALMHAMWGNTTPPPASRRGVGDEAPPGVPVPPCPSVLPLPPLDWFIWNVPPALPTTIYPPVAPRSGAATAIAAATATAFDPLPPSPPITFSE